MTSNSGPDGPQWSFPQDIGVSPDQHAAESHDSCTSEASTPQQSSDDFLEGEDVSPDDPPQPRVLPTRRCRFCWADVEPTVEMPSESLPNFLQPKPRVTYVDSDAAIGELIKPCLCKGTRRYVHEGCLREMRLGMMRARGSNWERHYHQCDICNFKYRLERMWFARAISSTLTQLLLTLLAILLLVFALGFVADPILNHYLEPYTTVTTRSYFGSSKADTKLAKLERSRWGLHFIKGFASVGVLSFFNVLTTIASPWSWWSLRNTLLQGGDRAGTTGRDRVTSIGWVVVLVGIATALWKLYTLTHYFASRYLLNMSDRVKNVSLADDDEDIKDVLHEHQEENPKTK